MGTRHVTMVYHEGRMKVAQYGQWDGYPDGQGRICYNFLKGADLEVFKVKLNRCKFMTERKEQEYNKFLKSIGAEMGLTFEQVTQRDEVYPYLNRDHGAGILHMIYNSSHRDGNGRTIWLRDETEFVANGLMCEYAYVIDLDKNTFEAYQGFKEGARNNTERFAYLNDKAENGYGPVALVKSYKINELPETADQFVEELNSLIGE